jgi:hypothetical protein
MYDIKVLNNKCKMGGGDVGPQCFVKDLLWVVDLVLKKEDSVSCWFKAHKPRQGQSQLAGFFCVFLCFLWGFLVFFVVVVFFTDLKTSLNNSYYSAIWLPFWFFSNICHVTSRKVRLPQCIMGDDLHINKQTNICIANHRRLLRQNN